MMVKSYDAKVDPKDEEGAISLSKTPSHNHMAFRDVLASLSTSRFHWLVRANVYIG